MAAASAALAEARARGPPMSPDHPPEAEEDDDCLLTPTAGRMAALLDPPMPSSSTTTTAPSAAVAAADDIPDHYLCPITKMIMTDPVFDAYGHSYENAAIEQWLTDHDTCPVTGALLPNKTLTKNHALRNAIEEEVRRRSAATTAAASSTIPTESTNPPLGDASSRMNRGGSTTNKKKRTAKSPSRISQSELDLLSDFDWGDADLVQETVLKSVSLKEQVNVLTKNVNDLRKSLTNSNRLFNSKLMSMSSM